MAVKPSGDLCPIREQIIEDKVSGLTLQFEFIPESPACVCLRIFGDLPNGNRELLFNANGELAATGTALAGPCRATWLKEIRSGVDQLLDEEIELHGVVSPRSEVEPGLTTERQYG